MLLDNEQRLDLQFIAANEVKCGVNGFRRAILIGFEWLDRNYGRFAKAFALTAGALILATTAMCLWAVTTRNLGMPSAWLGEVIMLLVLWIFLLPMAFTQLDGGMIRVTFFVEKMPQKVRPWLGLLASFSSVVFGLLLFKASFGFYQAVVPGGYFPLTHFPAAVQRAAVPICALLLAIAGVLCLVRGVLALVRGENSLETKV